jgi:hypothetical protein
MEQAGIVLRAPRVSKLGVPLSACADDGAFKLFAFDVGLLGAIAQLDESGAIEGNMLFLEFKGVLTEQYMCQELVALGLVPYYWSVCRSTQSGTGRTGCASSQSSFP